MRDPVLDAAPGEARGDVIPMYDKLIEKLRDDSMLENCEFDFVHKYMHEAADAIEELQKDLERSKDFEAFWQHEQHEAEETLKKFQVAISNKPRWIPVTERLPEKDQTVLAYCAEDNFCYISRMHQSFEDYDVTHWIPLPHMPKDGES